MDFDPDKHVLPPPPNVPITPETVVFKPHPDGCDTLVFQSIEFVAMIGGKNCGCVQPLALRICNSASVLLHDVVVYVDKAFDTQEEALEYAKRWIAFNHNRRIEFYNAVSKAAQDDFDAGKHPMKEIRSMVLEGLYDPKGVSKDGPCDPDTGEVVKPLTVLKTVNRLLDEEEDEPMLGYDDPMKELSPAIPIDKTPKSTKVVFPVFHLGKGKA